MANPRPHTATNNQFVVFWEWLPLELRMIVADIALSAVLAWASRS